MAATTTPTVTNAQDWLAAARRKLADGSLSEQDLDALQHVLASRAVRQKLLYIHATEPNVFCSIIAMNTVDPAASHMPEMQPTDSPAFAYSCVIEAMQDGWQVIHFPSLADTATDDGRVMSIGYEFILQKLEPCDDRHS